MRLVVFLLILANLLFFAWSRNDSKSATGPDALRVRQQLRADQIRIVSNDAPPPATARPGDNSPKPAPVPETAAPEAAVAPVTCVLLNDLPPAGAEKLEKSVSETIPGVAATRTVTASVSSFWVYIPPLKSRREAENKITELKNLGVKDYFIMQDSGPDHLAISLGLFSTADAANAALSALREKGVKSARVVERAQKPALAQLEIRAPTEKKAELDRWLDHAAAHARRSACNPQNGAAR